MGFFSPEEQSKIMHAINLAENRTSGEIRIAVESKLKGFAIDRAQYYFEKLGMHKTARRNGVLIYLAIDDHEFAIIGDKGINELVPHHFWEHSKETMIKHFRVNNFVEGLITGIQLAAEQLAEFFPTAKDDINELPNDIYFGD